MVKMFKFVVILLFAVAVAKWGQNGKSFSFFLIIILFSHFLTISDVTSVFVICLFYFVLFVSQCSIRMIDIGGTCSKRLLCNVHSTFRRCVVTGALLSVDNALKNKLCFHSWKRFILGDQRVLDNINAHQF